MPKIYLTIVFSLALILSGCSLLSTPQAPANLTPEPSNPYSKEISIGGVVLTVETAQNDAERAQGLSGRQSLPEGSGMVFLFDKPDRYSFWMKDMNFALDFIWLSKDQEVEITPQVPAPSAQVPIPATIRPSQPVTAVIEVPAGWAIKSNIKVGDKVLGLTR